MSELLRDEALILTRLVLDFVAHMESGYDVDRAESDELREQVSRVVDVAYRAS